MHPFAALGTPSIKPSTHVFHFNLNGPSHKSSVHAGPQVPSESFEVAGDVVAALAHAAAAGYEYRPLPPGSLPEPGAHLPPVAKGGLCAAVNDVRQG